MATANQVREVHKILDVWMRNKGLYADEVQMVRSLLPELPKQKTLAEIIAHVDDAWSCTSDNDWGSNSYDPNTSIEDWLTELRGQLEGLTEESGEVPALPAGMRLADHEEFGRVVATGWIDSDGEHFCVYYSDVLERGSYVFLPEDSLTFIDTEPAKPAQSAHPEFLQTGAEYQEAPWGTIVAMEDSGTAWIKKNNGWLNTNGDGRADSQTLWGVPRKVLRWGEHV